MLQTVANGLCGACFSQELTSMAPSKADISSLKSAANHANAGLPNASLCLAVSDARDLTCFAGQLLRPMLTSRCGSKL